MRLDKKVLMKELVKPTLTLMAIGAGVGLVTIGGISLADHKPYLDTLIKTLPLILGEEMTLACLASIMGYAKARNKQEEINHSRDYFKSVAEQYRMK